MLGDPASALCASGPLAWSLGSPGDQAVHWTAAVEVLDPVVVDTEATATWCINLAQRGLQSGAGSCSASIPTLQTSGSPTTRPGPAHPRSPAHP
jgi:hypothetical protein